MQIYKYNSKQGDWELVAMDHSIEMGLGAVGEPTVGAGVTKQYACVVRYDDSYGKQRRLLIAQPEAVVKINGRQAFPVQVLHDRDEIRFGGETMYFTDESPAQVVRFKSKEGEPPIFCARCKLVVKGEAVKCPGACGLWYHQNEESNCWTYDSQCVACQHPTGSRLSWKPAPRALTTPARRSLRGSV